MKVVKYFGNKESPKGPFFAAFFIPPTRIRLLIGLVFGYKTFYI